VDWAGKTLLLFITALGEHIKSHTKDFFENHSQDQMIPNEKAKVGVQMKKAIVGEFHFLFSFLFKFINFAAIKNHCVRGTKKMV